VTLSQFKMAVNRITNQEVTHLEKPVVISELTTANTILLTTPDAQVSDVSQLPEVKVMDRKYTVYLR